jgi:hypothetical protein
LSSGNQQPSPPSARVPRPEPNSAEREQERLRRFQTSAKAAKSNLEQGHITQDEFDIQRDALCKKFQQGKYYPPN